MSHLSNPLATPRQLLNRTASSNALPPELQDCIYFYTARLTQAAGILLQLPQDVTAKAVVVLGRFWLADGVLGGEGEFGDVSAASIYLIAKLSASPRSLRSITNVYAYLLSTSSALGNERISSTTTTKENDTTNDTKNETKNDTKPLDPETYYLSESEYISYRTRILHVEGQILNAIGFNTHVALPHPLAITYLQTLDVFNNNNTSPPPPSSSSEINTSTTTSTSTTLAKRTLAHLNTALLSPQMLYQTHQPSSLATAAIYLAAREIGVKLPEVEWWEVFDVDREELGFLVVGFRSLEGVVRGFGERGWGWLGKGWVERGDLRGFGGAGRGGNGSGVGGGGEMDEEDEMMRLLDEKVGGTE